MALLIGKSFHEANLLQENWDKAFQINRKEKSRSPLGGARKQKINAPRLIGVLSAKREKNERAPHCWQGAVFPFTEVTFLLQV